MGIVERARNILGANLNALLEKALDPLKVLKKEILDMEEAYRQMRRLHLEILAEKNYLEERLTSCAQKRRKWEERSRLALEKGREDLCRQALNEKQLLLAEERILKEALIRSESSAGELLHDIERLRLKIVEAKGKRSELLARAHRERLIRVAPGLVSAEREHTEKAIAELEVRKELERLRKKIKPEKGSSNS